MNSACIDLPDSAPLEVRGILQYVDILGREVGVEVEGGVLALDVPSDCAIYLREERVKLRFLQAGDHVHVTCSRRTAGLCADNICVNWTCLVPHRVS